MTLLTDFGTRDGYVGAMKGVIASLCPSALVHDLTHDIAPGDVRGGALALATSTASFPAGSIHVAVVDPGVGTARRGLLVEAGGQYFIGPDNGLLSLAATRPRRVRELDRPQYFRATVSSTFHGRDLFASVAGHLAAGRDVAELGGEGADMIEVSLPAVRRHTGGVTGEILHVDRFGNLVTTISRDDLPAAPRAVTVEVAGRAIAGLVSTYGDVEPGRLTALIGSGGRLEIAVRDGSAAAVLGEAAVAGAAVTVSAR